MDLGGNNLNGMMQAYADDYWSESNRNIYATFPRLSTTDIANNNRNSTWWLRDGSYLRLKSVEIGYTLPKVFVNKMFMQNVRIYVTGYNLYCFTKYSGADPEVDTRRSTPMTPGVDYSAYPKSRSFVGGINVTF